MPMTPDQQAKHVAEGSAFHNLADRITAYVVAKNTADAAQNALGTATTNLDTAWTAARAADQSLDDACFVPPAGYTPPV